MKKISPIHYLFGCRFDCLLTLLFQNQFKIEKGKRWQTVAMLFLSLVTYPFVLVEALFSTIFLYHKKMEKPPLFILGFWRSGTTYLQNLLCEDEQFSYLNCITSYTNSVCISLKPIVTAFMKKYAADFRFMDNMESKLDSPCEEEFAVANQTTKSLIHMSSFPQNFEKYQTFAFTQSLTPKERKKWRKDYEKVIKKVYFINKQKPLLLKSPDNTCHAKELAQMFPESKFIYIYRNPYQVICSFKHTITKMMEHFSLQEIPPEEAIEDFVINLYWQTMEQFRKDKIYLKEKLIEIKYEDFIQTPMNDLEKIYAQFSLPHFEKAKLQFQNLIHCQKNYKTNQYEISERLKTKIQTKLKEIFEEYGYQM